MADFSTLKAYIASYVKQNGVGAITGEILQDVLLEMVEAIGDEALNSLASALGDEITNRQNAVAGEAETRGNADTALQNAINAINTKLSEGYVYAGTATTTTNPGTPTGKVFYFALAAGTYTNFVDSGAASIILTQGISILKYNGTAWSSEQLTAIDDAPTDGSSAVVKSGGVFTAIAAVLSKVADGYLYRGIATTSTNPPTPQTKVFYIATAAGTYTNFGGTVLTQGINILKYDGSAWSGEQIVGFDDYPTASSTKLPKSGGVDSEIKSLVGYYTCSTAAATAAKTITAPTYILVQGGGIKVVFTYANTADNATLQIGSADAKPLFFNGARASSTNSWQAGQTLEIFYDGTNYQAYVVNTVDATPMVGSVNSVAGGDVAAQLNQYDALSVMSMGDGHMNSTNTWEYIGRAKHIILPIKSGDVIEVKKNSQPIVMGILKGYVTPKLGDPIDFAAGESRRVFSDTQSHTFTVSAQDARYLAMTVEIDNVSYAPSIFKINGYDFMTSVLDKLKLIQGDPFVVGVSEQTISQPTFPNSGFYYMTHPADWQSNNAYATTDYIAVEIGQMLIASLVVPTTVCAFTIYDSDYNLINYVGGQTDSQVVSDFTLDIENYPRAAYVKVTGRSGYTHTATLKTKSYTVSNLKDKLLKTDKDDAALGIAIADSKYDEIARLNNLYGIFDGQDFDMMVTSTGYQYPSEARHMIFAVKPNDVLYVKADSQPAVFAIVSGYREAKEYLIPLYATGESRRVVAANTEATVTITASDAKFVIFNKYYQSTVYIPRIITLNGHDIRNGEIAETIGASAKMFLGHSVMERPTRKYQLYLCYGQSFSDGSDSLYVQDPVVSGNYMLGNIIGSGTTLQPLQLSANGQHPIVSCVNSLSVLFRKYARNYLNCIAASLGVGGRSIAQLSKASRIQQYAEDYDYAIKDAGAYESRFLACLDNAVTAVGKQNVECPVIIYLQGERDYVHDQQDPQQPGSVDSAYACGGDAAMYKSRMMDLKNDMQADVMSKFGQKYKPIFCIYEVSGAFIKNDKMTINMAQIEFAQENDDVFLMPSPYFVPDYGAHLSTNGYRWYGEALAKAVFGILYQNSYWKPILPYQFKVSGSDIIISLENNVGKLELDSTLVEASTNSGFAVFINDSYNASNISSVSIDDNHIVITCNQSLTDKKVEVVYGGNKTSGSGNVRDNDVFQAMYTYWNDVNDHGADGTKTIGYRPDIVGQKYPMFNWLASFYKLVQES